MRKSITVIGLCAVLAMTTAAQAAQYQWSSGVDFSSGNFTDDQKTEILYIPFSGQVSFGDFTAKATVPYIRIKGPGTVVGGGLIGPITRGNTANIITTEDGLGDITAALTYTKFLQDNTLFVDFIGKIKLPTASAEKNLGTGQTDLTAQIDVSKRLDTVNLFVTGGYRFLGSSDIFELQSGGFASVGLSFDLSKKASAGLIYDYREASSLTAQAPSELTGFISWKVSQKIRLQTYGVLGFSNGSPDTGLGVQISFRP